MNKLATFVFLLFVATACSESEKRPSTPPTGLPPIQIEYFEEDSKEIIPDTIVSEPLPHIDTLAVLQKLVRQKYEDTNIKNLVLGDLDADGNEDALVVVSRICNENESVSEYSECYRLMVYTADDKNNFTLVLVNEEIIACSDCEHGPPTVTVESGEITFERTLGACLRDIFIELYQYDGILQNWFLQEVQQFTLNCNEGSEKGEVILRQLPTQTKKDFGEIRL